MLTTAPREQQRYHPSKHTLEGLRFGKWAVLEKREKRGNSIVYLCRCDCGKEREVLSHNLIYGQSQGCGFGCPLRSKTTPGPTSTYDRALYKLWQYKCSQRSLCEAWHDSFNAFRDGVGERPLNHSIYPKTPGTRIGPDNFVWETNRRGKPRKILEINGVSKTAAEWAKELGVTRQRVHQIANRKAGRCECGKPTAPGCRSKCDDCKNINRSHSKHTRAAKRLQSRLEWLESRIKAYQRQADAIRKGIKLVRELETNVQKILSETMNVKKHAEADHA